jgi:GNAT superfamily N-acetyltransferase
MAEWELIHNPLPGEDLRRLVSEGVDTHNIAATGIPDWYAANFFLRSGRGEWLGGVLATLWGGWLDLRYLWVAAAARGQGHGTRLLEAAEEYALERGCFAATLESHSFQAVPFYTKRGYEVFGKLEDYPPGHSKLYLRKLLVLR